jgi:hypothetical protein
MWLCTIPVKPYLTANAARKRAVAKREARGSYRKNEKKILRLSQVCEKRECDAI